MSRLLIVDDEPTVLNLLDKILTGQGYNTTVASNGEDALQLLEGNSYDLMISDINMAPINGMELLRQSRESHPKMGVIMLTAYGTVGTAVESMKEGAYDYVTKPFKLDELILTVQRALEYGNAIAENQTLKARLDYRERLGGIVAESASMRKACDMIERIAPTSTTVLISGESGTGKELLARTIHEHSPRKEEKFETINCAALPSQLMESEFFGHKKGAFSGASMDQDGIFETTDGGTLLIDEVGALPPEIQAKLLQFLQDKQVRKMGSSEGVSVDVRIIASSTEPLEKFVKQGSFREDLQKRLSVISINIPPLRSRQEDILPLADYILKRETGPDTPPPRLAPETQNILENYNWPSNVRELENALRHALTFIQDGQIKKENLPIKIVETVQEGIKSGIITSRHEEFKGKSLKAFLRDKEKKFLEHTIEDLKGNKEKAAEELGISLATLYRKLPGDDKS